MIHSTAIIDKTAFIHTTSSVGALTVIEEGVYIGKNVVIQGGCRIGKECYIDDDCVVKWGSILTQKVELQKGVFFGTQAVCLGSDSDRIEEHGTIIGEGCYIGARAIIFPAVSIINETIIGAGALIRYPIQAKGTYVGLQKQVK